VSSAPGVTFATKWDVATRTGVKLGTYKYEFTFGTLSKSLTVNIVNFPEFKISSVNAFNSSTDNQTLAPLGKNRFVLQHITNNNIYTMSIKGTLSGLNADQLYVLELDTLDATEVIFSADDLYDTVTAGTLTSAKQLNTNSIGLGKLQTVAVAATAAATVIYKLFFYNKVPVSVNTTTGVITYANEQVGVEQSITIVTVA
jgi:hypothetical protein